MNVHSQSKTGWSYILLFIALLILAFFVLRTSVSAADPDKYIQITVQPGDTLWEISEQYEAFTSLPHEQFIAWTERMNHVRSRKLIPGQTLLIPVEKRSFVSDSVLALR
ncbi:MAG TPA: LysM peptidoglycan-binding domain-containing protein [Bacillales bacterium]|nr:LysM peptidoglycan-binding domain-containing protein [Bacillales bacterium]